MGSALYIVDPSTKSRRFRLPTDTTIPPAGAAKAPEDGMVVPSTAVHISLFENMRYSPPPLLASLARLAIFFPCFRSNQKNRSTATMRQSKHMQTTSVK